MYLLLSRTEVSEAQATTSSGYIRRPSFVVFWSQPFQCSLFSFPQTQHTTFFFSSNQSPPSLSSPNMQPLGILLPCLALMSSSRVVVLASAAAVPPPASLSGRQQEDVVVQVPAPVHQNNKNEGAAPEEPVVVVVVVEAPRAPRAARAYENSCPDDDRPHPLCCRRLTGGGGLGTKVGCVLSTSSRSPGRSTSTAPSARR